ncbi:hypothetical protein [Pantoea vagans]|uniref:hypothetical protein n=1 Tax=Pantoea vagans TaxID=470934 RepID=UPI0028A67531|nr:hypothetical protein [Pantoea vagans]
MKENFDNEWKDFSTPPELGQECIVQWPDDEVSGGWLYAGYSKESHWFTDTQTEYEKARDPKYWIPLPEPKK